MGQSTDQQYISQPSGVERVWWLGSQRLVLGRSPLLMGIVNVTPDSFSDGGDFLETQAAVDHALSLIEDGADVIDIGGESTRPGSTPIGADEEIARVIPVIEKIARQVQIPISIDTTKAVVARQALEAGATIVNDISGLTFDDEMPNVCAEASPGVVCMHIQGIPQTMQLNPEYKDVVNDICQFFSQRLDELHSKGIAPERIILDPGIGFGKTAEHNLQILSNIQKFRALGRPVLIGHSRKRFLGKVLGRTVDERVAGTLGLSISLAAQSTDIIRVHDVRATRDALLAWAAVL